jgi:ATP-dependent DNA ligase
MRFECQENQLGNLLANLRSKPLLDAPAADKSPRKRPRGGGESLTAEKMKQCRWVKPKLVSQVAFVEWTVAGHLRHCTFAAMRDDKKSAEVVRENLSSPNSDGHDA